MPRRNANNEFPCRHYRMEARRRHHVEDHWRNCGWARLCYDGGELASATPCHKGMKRMKNPLDSLGQTVTLGFVLTIVVILLIHAIA
jgi:hypothetical protein